ncbi:MAG: FHA domain-containing protein [Methyloprofundus sp.]|nr:FHA domain-containing protein [Methyloprofundus sp.]
MKNKSLVIFFSDVVGSTSIYEQHGNYLALQLISGCIKGMITDVEQNNGTLIKTIGDEVMACFPDANCAFQAAVSIQLRQQGLPVSVRIGFHYGEVIEKDNDYFGNAVNVAARIASRATANEIMTTEQTVLCLSEDKRSNTRFLSDSTVKGKNEVLSIYEVLWNTSPDDDLTIMSAPLGENKQPQCGLELLYQQSIFQLNATHLCLSVGRSADNEIVINDELASRKHAKIELKNSRFILTDTSSNGTYVVIGDNEPIKIVRDSIELVGTGQIELGRYTPESVQSILYRRVRML